MEHDDGGSVMTKNAPAVNGEENPLMGEAVDALGVQSEDRIAVIEHQDRGPADGPGRLAALSRFSWVPTSGWTWQRMFWPLEVLVVLLGNMLYEVVRAVTHGDPEVGVSHALSIYRAEPSFITSLEEWMNRTASENDWIVQGLAYYYSTFHFLLTPAVLFWAWLRYPEIYGRVRSVLFAVSLSALFVFWVFPVAPPRLSVDNAVDVLSQANVFGMDNPHNAVLVNDYAAVPSLHAAWAAWCAWVLVLTLRSRWRHLAWIYPALTTVVVIASAHHFVFDAVAGFSVLALAVWLVPRPRQEPGAENHSEHQSENQSEHQAASAGFAPHTQDTLDLDREPADSEVSERALSAESRPTAVVRCLP
ncbi:MAG: hypothetical protein QG608_2290 [Actinomycetota bacterium]|nr:hypothetical protein [Actinomycetota bacterium]